MISMSLSQNAMEPNLGPQIAIVLGLVAVIIQLNLIIVWNFNPKIFRTVHCIQSVQLGLRDCSITHRARLTQ